jgi:Hemolysin activation/secretion protein
MRKSFFVLLSAALLSCAPVQSAGQAISPAAVLAAQPDEEVLLPELKSIVLLPAVPNDVSGVAPANPGVDASRVSWLQGEAFAREMAPFLGQPVSLASLDRLQMVIRTHLQLLGRPFARVYAPPQDITDGTVRIVVQLASLGGEVSVDGNKWFGRERYTGTLRARSGEALDAAALNADLAWLNRNPFTHVTPVVEAGDEPGTTRVTLRAEERFPFSFSAGYDNTGTRNTDEDRVSASVQWGNALGRGDLMSYRLSGDPSFDHLRSHSLSYTAFLPWRHVLTLQAALSEIDSVMPAPFTQGGTSWQVAARYELPLAPLRNGWTQSLSFGGDFKYSDNTLEFATIPVTDNVTHIAQVGATYGVTFPVLGGRSSATVSGYASPGGLTRYNGDRAFGGSRPGAQADYVYGKLTLTHQRALPLGFSWSTVADFQAASGALLGSEQLSGAGTYAVRGYRENSAFGDEGVVMNNELHLPPLTWAAARTQVDAFVFLDAASLHLNVDDDNVELSSAGFGANAAVNRWLSVRFAYGWQWKKLPGSRDRGHGHVSANVSW